MICTALISHLTVLIFLHLVASCYEQWDKLPLEGPLGTRADFSWRQKFLNSWGRNILWTLTNSSSFYMIKGYCMDHSY